MALSQLHFRDRESEAGMMKSERRFGRDLTLPFPRTLFLNCDRFFAEFRVFIKASTEPQVDGFISIGFEREKDLVSDASRMVSGEDDF